MYLNQGTEKVVCINKTLSVDATDERFKTDFVRYRFFYAFSRCFTISHKKNACDAGNGFIKGVCNFCQFLRFKIGLTSAEEPINVYPFSRLY